MTVLLPATARRRHAHRHRLSPDLEEPLATKLTPNKQYHHLQLSHQEAGHVSGQGHTSDCLTVSSTCTSSFIRCQRVLGVFTTMVYLMTTKLDAEVVAYMHLQWSSYALMLFGVCWRIYMALLICRARIGRLILLHELTNASMLLAPLINGRDLALVLAFEAAAQAPAACIAFAHIEDACAYRLCHGRRPNMFNSRVFCLGLARILLLQIALQASSSYASLSSTHLLMKGSAVSALLAMFASIVERGEHQHQVWSTAVKTRRSRRTGADKLAQLRALEILDLRR